MKSSKFCDDAPPTPLLTMSQQQGGGMPKPPQLHGLSSLRKTFGNIFISIVGAGVLGLPYTFRRTGWIVSSIVLPAVALASYYCMMLLVWSRKRLEKNGNHDVFTYSDLGFLTFGKWGRMAVDAMVVLTQGAFCVAYLIFIGENLASVFVIENAGAAAAMAGNALAHDSSSMLRRSLLSSSSVASTTNNTSLMQSLSLFLSTKRTLSRNLQANRLGSFFFRSWSSKEAYIWIIFPFQIALASIRSLTRLAPFSLAADVINFLAMVIVMEQDVVKVTGNGIAEIAPNQGLVSLPFAIGVAIYAFEGFGLVLPLESSMKERRKFGRVLGLAMASITTLYMIFGLLGYFAFGEETQDIITLNLGQSWKTITVKVGLCVGLLFTFPVMMHPVHEVMERRLLKERASLSLRAVVVLGSVWCAVAVPRFGDFLSLIGSSVCCLLAFVLPALFHIQVFRGELSCSVGLLDYLLVGFGSIFGVWGTISALQAMIRAS